MNWISSNWEQLFSLAWSHLGLALPPIILSFLLSLPLGWAAYRMSAQHRSRRFFDGGAIIVGLTSILYAIPSLALFLLLPVILDSPILSPFNVISALLLYGIALQTRVVAESFTAASDIQSAAVGASSALGYSEGQRILQVELPLAGPGILAGVRVVSASTISMVSVGALIGVSSLGDLITQGFLRNYPEQIIVGTLAIIVLALLMDALLVLLGRLIMPWQKVLQEAGHA